MGLEDRIESEMVVDTEELLEEEFDRVKGIVKILDDGTVDLHSEYQDINARGRILAYLIGKVYASKTDRVDSDALSYEVIYPRFDLDNSTIRDHMSSLEDEGLVESTSEKGEKRLVVENLSRALNRIEGSVE